MKSTPVASQVVNVNVGPADAYAKTQETSQSLPRRQGTSPIAAPPCPNGFCPACRAAMAREAAGPDRPTAGARSVEAHRLRCYPIATRRPPPAGRPGPAHPPPHGRRPRPAGGAGAAHLARERAWRISDGIGHPGGEPRGFRPSPRRHRAGPRGGIVSGPEDLLADAGAARGGGADGEPKARALAREAALTTTAAEWLAEIEQQAHEQPERAYVALPGDWGRVLFILKDRDRFVGYEYGGAQVWTRKGGELDYFLAAPLGVQVLSRESAIALLAQAIEKGA